MSNDVTAGYIMRDVERLRKPMQQVTNFLVKHINACEFNDVNEKTNESLA